MLIASDIAITGTANITAVVMTELPNAISDGHAAGARPAVPCWKEWAIAANSQIGAAERDKAHQRGPRHDVIQDLR